MTVAAKPETSVQPKGWRCDRAGRISAEPIFYGWVLGKNSLQQSIDFGLAGFQPTAVVAHAATGQQEYQNPPWAGQLARAVRAYLALAAVSTCPAHP